MSAIVLWGIAASLAFAISWLDLGTAKWRFGGGNGGVVEISGMLVILAIRRIGDGIQGAVYLPQPPERGGVRAQGRGRH